LLNVEQTALSVFRKYLIEPGQMLCFHGPSLEEHGESLRQLTAQGMLTKDKFDGGYSLTRAGFAAMNDCHEHPTQ
jgi:hypothetical protein